MSGETAPPAVFRSATPQFTVPDVVRAAEYYRDVFGFEIAGYWDGERVSFNADPPPHFGIVRRGHVKVFFSRANQSEVRTACAEGGCDVYIDVTGVDALAAQLSERGADVLDGPEDRVYKQRELVVRDCHGLVLVFAEDTSGRAA